MDLRHLEQIAEICRQGSFSSAARRLGVTQPTLSKSIARLEARLCAKLFERVGGAVRPTTAGQFLAARAEKLLQEASILTRELETLALGEDGRLRIGFGPAPRARLLTGVIERTAAAFPRLQLEVRFGQGDDLTRGVQEGRYDLVFTYAERARRDFGDLIRSRIFEDRHVAAVRPGHPALTLAPLGPAELLRYPISSTGLIESFADWLGAMSDEQRKRATAFVADDCEVVKLRAQGTDFIVRLPHFALAAELEAGTLAPLPLTWSARYECWMLTTEARWRSPVVKAIAEIAKAAVEQRAA